MALNYPKKVYLKRKYDEHGFSYTHVYRDRNCKEFFCEFPVGHKQPRKDAKKITLNCWNWKPVWI